MASDPVVAGVEISVSYKGYTPPVDAVRIVTSLIDTVPARYLAGLQRIVLTNSEALSHDRRRLRVRSRGRTARGSNVAGLYHAATRTTRAWIEIFVDRILADAPRLSLHVPVLRHLTFAGVVFHEVGHHIHRTVRPDSRDAEQVADDWGTRLTWSFLERRHRLVTAGVHLALWARDVRRGAVRRLLGPRRRR